MKIVGDLVNCSDVVNSIGRQLLLIVSEDRGVHVKPVRITGIADQGFKADVVLPTGAERRVRVSDLRHFAC